jgi:repressor LexA
MQTAAVPLTARQLAVLRFIAEYTADFACPPSIRDIGERFGISSPNGVLCHLRALAKKGLVEPAGGSHRGWRVPAVAVATRTAAAAYLTTLGG